MYGILQILFTILLAADKKMKTSKCFIVIIIFNVLSFVSKKGLPYYVFKTSLGLNQTESVRFTQFITGSTEPRNFTLSMEEELKKRKSVRAGHKGQVTKVITVCNEIN